MENRDVSFLTFFLMWAKLQRWKVPMLHVRLCVWLETCTDPVRVLMIFRGASKSTTYAVYKAWKLYRDPARRSLVWAADGTLAKKLTRDTIHVLRRHPLCKGMLPSKPGAASFWVTGATDARNASMEAVGVNSNATGARADDIDYDDIEVPKNIKTADGRLTLRQKIEDSTHIAVPGAQETYIGTPHTHASIYTEQIDSGAAVLKIPLFENAVRYEQTDRRIRYPIPFEAGADGLYVLVGIHKPARMLVEGVDYALEGNEIVFNQAPGAVLDIYANCAWPERFTRKEVELRRKKTRTLNSWDSQYQLEAKPLGEVRLDPAVIKPYAVQPVVGRANKQLRMMLGKVQIVSARAYWDCATGKVGGDDSAFSLMLDDDFGNNYWHVCTALTGEYAKFADTRNTKIVGGQVMQACALVKLHHIPSITVETNGVGSFAPKLLRRALQQEGLICAVVEKHRTGNKNENILAGLEPPMKSGTMWAHVDVLNGPMWDQMKDWKADVKDQPDDYLDSGAGAALAAPVRIGRLSRIQDTPKEDHWQPNTGVFEVSLEE